MKVTAVYGSPRSGSNSTYLTDYFISGLESGGAEIRKFYLNKMKYRGCQGCMGCKSISERCVLNDDLSDTLESLYESDMLIISSGVYFGDVTSQTKGFMDRIYSFYKNEFWLTEDKTRMQSGKKLVFILSQGNPEETLFSDIAPRYHTLLKTHGFEQSYLIRGCGLFMPGDAVKRKDLLLKIDETINEIRGLN
jgi:multimeric flavodoxin WrbA